jgi:hypothetical protein
MRVDGLDVLVEPASHHTVVRLRGTPGLHNLPAARTAIDKALVDHGTAVVDLAGLERVPPICLTIFPAVLAAHGGWPWAKLALSAADAELTALLDRTRIRELVPCWATEDAALAGIQTRPPWVRHHASLACGRSAPARARATVVEACLAWALPPRVRDAAELIASELATNVVLHAGTDMTVAVQWRSTTLRIGLRDFTHRQPPAHPAGRRAVGRGLELVATLAKRWGVTPHTDGKTVWARIHTGAETGT